MKTPQTAVAAVALCAAALAHPLLAAPVWEAGQYAPGSWRPLDGNNLLLGRSAQMTGDYYVEWGRCVDGADLGLLTDGTVPGDSPEFCIVGITAGVTLTWTFDAPVVIDALRITSRWWDAGRDGIGIDAVRVRYADSDGWVSLDAPILSYMVQEWGNNLGTGALYATLSDTSGALARSVTAIRIEFGPQDNSGAGYAEIEAVGTPASEEPMLSAAVAGGDATSATVLLDLVWAGIDADSADLYVASGPAGAVGGPVLAAEGIAADGCARYHVDGLEPGVEYVFEAFASNSLGRVSSVASCTFVPAECDASLLRVNEIMATGDPDWFEIYNPNPLPVDISDWRVTDDPSKKFSKWKTFPEGAFVPAGGYLVVRCADAAGRGSGGVSVDLGLSASGEAVAIARTEGDVVSQMAFPQQFDDVSYGCAQDASSPGTAGAAGYLAVPTPGAANAAVAKGDPTPPVAFSEPHGYKTAPFDLELSCPESPDLVIRYTLDGTEPSASSPRYESPLRVSSTTVVRAAAERDGALFQRNCVSTYIFLDDVLAEAPSGQSPGGGFPADGAVNGQVMRYGMRQDLVNDPQARAKILRGFTNTVATISVAIDPANLFNASTGIYVNCDRRGREWERAGMVEQIDPVRGAENEFSAPAGLRIRGAASRSAGNPKHSLRLFFRSDYGRSSVDFPFFGDAGAGSFKRMDLRTAQNYSWANSPFEGGRLNDAFVTESFERDAMLEAGQPSTRSYYFNLFVNGRYWGLYQTQERADDHFAETYLGGDSSDYDSYNVNDLNSGNDSGRTALYAQAKLGFEDDADYLRVQGLGPDGVRDPSLPVLLDVTNLVVRTVIGHYAADGDSPCSIWGGFPNNYFAVLDHTSRSTGFKWFCHDGEHSLGMGVAHGAGAVDESPVQWGADIPDNPLYLNLRLMENAEYRTVWADQVYALCCREGALLSVSESVRRFRARTAEIDDVIVCEAARWGRNGETYATWTNACAEIVDGFIRRRLDYLIPAYREAGWYPQIDPPALELSADRSEATLSAAEGAEIFYTADGSDPRARGGAPSASAQTYTGAFAVPADGARIMARARKDGEWSALAELDPGGWRPPAPPREIEYVEGDGTQRVGLDYAPTSRTRVQAVFRYADGHGGCFVGTRKENDVDDWRFFSSKDKGDSTYLDYPGGSRLKGDLVADSETVYSLEFGNFYVKDLSTGEMLLSGEAVSVPEPYPYSVWLFSLAADGSYSYGAVYGLKFFEGDELVRDYRPALDAEGVACLYETQEGRWYYPEGGPLAAGPEKPRADAATCLRVAGVMSVPVSGGDDGEEYIVLTNLNAEAELDLGGVRVTCTKDGDAAARCDFTLPAGTSLAAGASLTCRKADLWPDGKITNGAVNMMLYDAYGAVVQTLHFDVNWHGNATDGTGAHLIALEFGRSVTGEGQWRPSFLPPEAKAGRKAIESAVDGDDAVRAWIDSLGATAEGQASISAFSGTADAVKAAYLVGMDALVDPEAELRIVDIRIENGGVRIGGDLEVLGEGWRSRVNGSLRLYRYESLGAEPDVRDLPLTDGRFPLLDAAGDDTGTYRFFRLGLER